MCGGLQALWGPDGPSVGLSRSASTFAFAVENLTDLLTTFLKIRHRLVILHLGF